MRFAYAVIGLLASCSDSPEERLEQFEAEVTIDCWTYFCPGTMPGPRPEPIDDVVACMNDALASGARARASWGADDFAAYTYDGTRVFTVDHQIKVFTVHQFGEDPAEIRELPNDCAGPFRVGPSLCGASGSNGQIISVQALAWDGCP